MFKPRLFISLFAIATLFSACANRNLRSNKTADKELLELYQMMSGTFSSAEQAQQDSLFYDINLVMYPIWEQDATSKWLYVEQAVSQALKKPYRQRVYQLVRRADGVIESRVFELPQPKRFIHAWDQPKVFDSLQPDSLILRTGCAVLLQKEGKQCFSGATKDKDCKSVLRGASYATSKVNICPNQISSWDQGWDGEDQQVWGATTEGYVFRRKGDKLKGF
ncbi:MAG: chromophore lyase CpcT/CpeT [Bacteroidota bacterium]